MRDHAPWPCSGFICSMRNAFRIAVYFVSERGNHSAERHSRGLGNDVSGIRSTMKIWDEVKSDLSATVGASNHSNWIEPLTFCGIENGIAQFSVPTTFIGNYVNQNFGEQILYHLTRRGHDVARLRFAAAPETAARAAHAPAQPTPAPARQEASSPLDPKFTFDRFVVGKPNQLAYSAARRVAEGAPVTFNPLFLYGGVGLGKTHLMHAIANELHDKRPDLNVLYLTSDQFIVRFVSAIRNNSMFDFKQAFRSVDVLMVDDVQFIAGKHSTQEEFFHTFNALVDAGKQIIISADRAPGEIKDLEARITSRLQCGLVVDLHPTDYELRLGILQSKVEQHREFYPDLAIDAGILEFLAHRIAGNVRILEGALTRLFAFANLIGRPIDMDLTQECLSDVLRASDRKITVEEIQRKVSEHFNIRLADMIGPRRQRIFARPRQIAMYLAKHMTQRSLPEIGRRFGGRDHTTVMHGVRKIEELKSTDAQIADDLELLRRALEGA